MNRMRIALAICLALTALGYYGSAHADTLSQEWAAVQIVVGPEWDAHSFMAPVDNATGTQAISDAGVLGLDDQTFFSYQTQHPAYLMAAIERLFRYYYSSGGGIFVVESVNSQLDLVAVGGLTPAQEADLLTRVCTEPLATTFLQPVATPTATPSPIPTPVPYPTPHAQGGPPLFPPRATFVLPVQYGIPRRITFTPLAPTNLPGPIKPLSRTEYDANGGTLSYRISVFDSASDAVKSIRWQLAQSSVKLLPLPILYSEEPNLYTYSVSGFDVVLTFFRNIEMVVSGIATSHQVDIYYAARALYQQAQAYAVIEPLGLVSTLDSSGPPIFDFGANLIIPTRIAGGQVRLLGSDGGAVYAVSTPGWRTTYAPDRSYTVSPMPTDLIAQATQYDHSNDALVSYFRELHWSFTEQHLSQPAIAGERAFWVNYSKAPDREHTGGGAFAEFAYRNLIVTVEWDVARGAFDPAVLRHVSSIAQAVVVRLHYLARHG